MTQAVIGTAPVAAAVAAPVELGEPTMEELAALVGDPLPEPTAPEAPTPAATDPAAAVEEPIAATPDVDAAAARAEKAAAAARAGSRRYAAMQEQQRETQAAAQRAAREAEQLRQRVAQAEALDRELKEDPYKALKGRGMTDADLAARALRENTPEAVTQRLADELRAEREARLALESRLEQQAREQRNASARAKAHADLVSATEDESSCPGLSQLTPDGRLDMVRLALGRIEANGHPTDHLTLPQIVEAGEKYLAMVRKTKAAPTPAPKPAATAASKPSGKTLTNALAQTRTVAPADWDSLSDEQQMAHIAASLPEPT